MTCQRRISEISDTPPMRSAIPMSLDWSARVNRLQTLCLIIASLMWLFSSGLAHAYENGYQIELETGGLWQSRNLAQSPNAANNMTPAGTRFSFKSLQGSGPNPYFRISAAYTWDDKHRVHALYAPLKITGTGTLEEPVLFQGSLFAPGEQTRALYRFDSYRIGYRYRVYASDSWRVWLGATVKLRDANIALAQGSLKANRANTGPVPLLSIYARKTISSRWSAILDAEGLAAPQGRALDAAVKLRYQLESGAGVSAGYRMLEGGADNKKVYTFAWLHYGLISFDYRF